MIVESTLYLYLKAYNKTLVLKDTCKLNTSIFYINRILLYFMKKNLLLRWERFIPVPFMYNKSKYYYKTYYCYA